MSSDAESDADESATAADCPSCGRPITAVTVVGPTDAVAAPCGCRVSPAILENARLE